jgi:hypothetical protein
MRLESGIIFADSIGPALACAIAAAFFNAEFFILGIAI